MNYKLKPYGIVLLYLLDALVVESASTCMSFTCVQDRFRSATPGPLNISQLIQDELGEDAHYRFESAIEKIRWEKRIIDQAISRIDPIGIEILGRIPSFIDNTTANYQGLFIVEQGGFIAMHSGITVTKRRRLQSKIVADAAGKLSTWSGASLGTSVTGKIASVVGVGFVRILGLVLGENKVPDFGFLIDRGNVGILISQRARLNHSIYKSVKLQVENNIISSFHLRGVLADESLTRNKILVIGTMEMASNSSNPIYKVASKVVPPGSLLKMKYDPGYSSIGALNSLTSKRVYAGIGNIEFHPEFVVHEASLFVDVGISGFYPGISGTVIVIPPFSDREIRLRTDIAVGLPYYDLWIKVAMEGMYEKLFDIPFLHAGNIQGEIDYTLATGFPYLFRFGTELWIGKVPLPGEPNSVRKFKGYIGFSLFNPAIWYVYGYLSDITIQSLADLITSIVSSHRVLLPKFIGETGLQGIDNNGILFSFTPITDYTVDDVSPPLRIRAGLYFQGKVDFFGIAMGVDLNVNFMKLAFDFKFTMDPISLGNGIVKLSRSIHNNTVGPIIELRAGLAQNVTPLAHIEGFAAFLGMGMGFRGYISDDGVEISGDLLLFNVLQTQASMLWNRTDDTVELVGNITQRLGFMDILEESTNSIWKGMFLRQNFHRRRLKNMHHLLESVQELQNVPLQNFWDSNDVSHVTFTDGSRLERRKLFELLPFGIRIEKMSFRTPLHAHQDNGIEVLLTIRRRWFGKISYRTRSAVLDINNPQGLIPKILHSVL